MAKQKPDLRKISEMRNLGPACEKDLNLAGINTAQELKRVGVKQAFVQMLLARKNQGRSTKCCNAAYLYAIHGAVHDIDWRELPQSLKEQYKAFAAELRDSGQFR
jgi:DNA transformation protein